MIWSEAYFKRSRRYSTNEITVSVFNPHLSMEIGEEPLLRGVDEVLDFGLQAPPFELHGHQLVGSHDRINRFLK